MTKAVFKSIFTLMNKITKLRDGIQRILAIRIFNSFAKPDRGLIHLFISEPGCITPQKLGHQQKAIQFLLTKKFYLH